MATTLRGDDNFDSASPIGSAVAPTVTCQVNQLSTQNIVGDVGVSSITDIGTGQTTVTFSSAFSDTAYTSTTGGGAGPADPGSGFRWCSLGAGSNFGGTVYTTSQVNFTGTYSSSNQIDLQYAMITCIPT
ncbi:hypothetical protein OAA60_03795 [Porticoccaceae bacterium]|nr:hypothetical protein [Gammaproteobacteria bacterium]MDB4352538.1 hypothetical protein [Porticoccaceae bacterium]